MVLVLVLVLLPSLFLMFDVLIKWDSSGFQIVDDDDCEHQHYDEHQY